jgi:hypothetical protein
MRPTISPLLTVRSTFRTAVRPPKRIVTPRASSTVSPGVAAGAVPLVVVSVVIVVRPLPC